MLPDGARGGRGARTTQTAQGSRNGACIRRCGGCLRGDWVRLPHRRDLSSFQKGDQSGLHILREPERRSQKPKRLPGVVSKKAATWATDA
jgi:hypothetical protein